MASLLAILLASTAAQAQEWTLVWGDEFDYAGAPDPAKWGYETGHFRNNEAQYYTDRRENVRVENGLLVIEARKEAYSGYQYTSASIHTMTTDRKNVLFSTTGGRLEVRAKLPAVSGSWAAFWTLGADSWTEQGGWPRSGEIDVFEYVAHTPHAVFGNLHYEGTDGIHKDNVKDYNLHHTDWQAAPFHTDFHIFRVDWHEDRIEWYVDDIKYHEVSLVGTSMAGNPFGDAHYLILNLAVGGSWGSPIAEDYISDQYLVDYVRVYQLGSTIPEPAQAACACAIAAAVAIASCRPRHREADVPVDARSKVRPARALSGPRSGRK